jgi:hypothetical protein
MKTEFDLRLAYKADTGVLPIRGDVESLRGDFELDFDFENNADPDNEDACMIAEQAMDVFEDMKMGIDGLVPYIKWLEERLLNLENNKSIKRRRTK